MSQLPAQAASALLPTRLGNKAAALCGTSSQLIQVFTGPCSKAAPPSPGQGSISSLTQPPTCSHGLAGLHSSAILWRDGHTCAHCACLQASILAVILVALTLAGCQPVLIAAVAASICHPVLLPLPAIQCWGTVLFAARARLLQSQSIQSISLPSPKARCVIWTVCFGVSDPIPKSFVYFILIMMSKQLGPSYLPASSIDICLY